MFWFSWFSIFLNLRVHVIFVHTLKSTVKLFQIPVISDLHVGHNFHDHLNMPLYVSIDAPVSVTVDKVQQISELWDYMIRGKGNLLICFS